ncbi:MAG: hypothetical protein LC798_05235 [Chloroflexi bacterium]|nr:hypothetical protein [Chloroflexota bacterium]
MATYTEPPRVPESATSVRNLADGSQAAPSIAFADDQGTGIFSTSNGRLDIVSEGVIRAIFMSTQTGLSGQVYPLVDNTRDLGFSATTFRFRDLNLTRNVVIGALAVVGTRKAAVADADGTLAGATAQLNALLTRLRATGGHGLIAD